MSCQIDIKAYSFGELTANERREADLHMKSCEACRGELGQLQLVQAALGGLREEEPPRRIAFVSDKVFEPNRWQRFWASGPRVGFAGAGLLASAILVHALTVPATVINPTPPAPIIASRANDQEIQSRIDSAVAKAVTLIEEKQKANVDQLLAATEKKYELERKALAIIADDNFLLRKRNEQLLVQTAGLTKQ